MKSRKEAVKGSCGLERGESVCIVQDVESYLVRELGRFIVFEIRFLCLELRGKLLSLSGDAKFPESNSSKERSWLKIKADPKWGRFTEPGTKGSRMNISDVTNGRGCWKCLGKNKNTIGTQGKL